MMRNPQEHPSREDLIRVLKTGRNHYAAHLRECAGCREMFEMLKVTLTYREQVTETASADLILRCAAIPLLARSTRPQRKQRGRLQFDSWSTLPAMALRSIDLGGERRLRLSAGSYTLELVAQRQSDRWEFWARIIRKGTEPIPMFVIQAGRRKIAAGAHSVFAWSDRYPPRRMSLISSTMRIEFEPIDWSAAAEQ
jgi:hypothetical protein